MRFPNSFLDDIRDRLRISEVVGSRVTFDKKKSNPGRGDFWACCPFHGEKTPSFHCEDRKGRYHCFGCGVSGDHFRFLTELDGTPFPEVVELLAGQAGLAMPVMDRREQEREEKRATLYEVMEMAAAYFRDQLQASVGANARAYLRERGMNGQTQQEFSVGYAPDSRNALKEFLASKGVSHDQMVACGLVVHGSDIPVSYDRFRDRIMFPIPDSKGRVIAFGGRAMKADAMAKYLNSPETELFHKSNVLFNYARARRPAYEKKQVIAAEGYMDVIALHAAGFDNAVAPLGTALTERQMELLWRLNEEPILCFDGDGAGLKAAYRAIDVLLPALQPGRSARFAMLPEGMDPDDLIRDNGASAMGEVLGQSLALSQMIWNRESSAIRLDTPEKRAEFERNLFQVIGQIRDENVRRHYTMEMQQRLAGLFQPNQGRAQTMTQTRGQTMGQRSRAMGAKSGAGQWGNNGRGAGARRQSQGRLGGISGSMGGLAASSALLNSSLVRHQPTQPSLREAVLVMAAYHHPVIVAEHFEEFSSLDLENRTARQMHAALLEAVSAFDGEGEEAERQFISGFMVERGLSEIAGRMITMLRENRIWQALPDADPGDAIKGWQQALHLQIRNRTLDRELEAAERALASEDSQENLERLLQIRKELENNQGTEALIDGFGVSSGRSVKAF